MNKLLQEAIATEFSRGCMEKCKIFFEKSREDKFVKSSQLEDFFKKLFEEEFEFGKKLFELFELYVLFKAEGLRKIDLSAWIRSMLLRRTLALASALALVTFK